MTKQTLLTIAVVLLLAMNGVTVWSLLRHPHRPPGPPPEERPKMLVIDRLGFSADQVAKYEQLISAHRQAIETNDMRLREAREALFNDLRHPDDAVRDSLANVIGGLQAAVERVNHDHFAQVRALCRPDQLPKFDALIGELSGFFGQRPPPGPRP